MNVAPEVELSSSVVVVVLDTTRVLVTSSAVVMEVPTETELVSSLLIVASVMMEREEVSCVTGMDSVVLVEETAINVLVVKPAAELSSSCDEMDISTVADVDKVDVRIVYSIVNVEEMD